MSEKRPEKQYEAERALRADLPDAIERHRSGAVSVDVRLYLHPRGPHGPWGKVQLRDGKGKLMSDAPVYNEDAILWLLRDVLLPAAWESTGPSEAS